MNRRYNPVSDRFASKYKMPSPLKSVKHAVAFSDRKDIDLSKLLRPVDPFS
jgi:hypothetical protein